ncbi:MAG: hypothetical protein K6357_01670 [Elusimicrobiota bacterium]
MKKQILLFFIFFIPVFAYPRPHTNKTDQIIVKLKKKISLSFFNEKLKKIDVSQRKGLKIQREFDTDKYIIKLNGRKNYLEIEEIINELKKEFEIEYAEPDKIAYPLLIPNDYGFQWHYKSTSTEIGAINLPQAWDITTGSTSTIVAVLDTGILPHEDLSSSKILGGYDMISNSDWARDGNGYDSNPRDEGDWLDANDQDCGDGEFH